MDLHLHIDDRLVGFVRRIFRRRLARVGIGLAVLASAGLIYAQTTGLTVFQPGTAISSSQVNANFAALDAKIGAAGELLSRTFRDAG